MDVKRFLLVLVCMISLVILPACKMPASTPPSSTATTAGGFPVPGTETMGLFETIATQTALAAQGQTNPQATQPPANVTAPPPGKTPKPTKTPTTVGQPPAVSTPKPTKVPVVVPTATAGVPTSYTLQAGEFPYCIARRFDVNPSDLLSVNGLSTASTVYAGMALKIPQNSSGFPDGRSLHKHPATYTVKANDTIYTIACYYGDVNPILMAQINNLAKPYKLTAGETLQVP